MDDYKRGPSAISNNGITKIETYAKVREDGFFSAVIRLVEGGSSFKELEIGLIKFEKSQEACLEAQIVAMNYFGVSRADGVWIIDQKLIPEDC
ncbi:hypothetical protein GTP46_08770 [Duganella sp. FT135W]|uniref:Uncharacterized protein n=1 Tax=Duganella flavida TaxID=2692175 RepID=A0A6L8K5Q6_9BURK|nr:hypothetical protein [Duganella flavida]MYM22736.1 hypothetical protein [Duganella flavida]